jgi:hypothetical protein
MSVSVNALAWAIAPDCHPEHIRFTQCKLREGSVSLGVEMLRCAQHDRAAVFHTSAKRGVWLLPSIVPRAAAPDCHPEHIRFTQCKLREGSVAMGAEMLRCAQHDRAVTHTDGRINLFICINSSKGVLTHQAKLRPGLIGPGLTALA